MTPTGLKAILDKHAAWLSAEKGGSRANLRGANLRGADLRWANLRWADLSRAELSWADLSWADLSWVVLGLANLSGANLSRADLSRADLSWVDLGLANLSGADLSRADLSGANLRGRKVAAGNCVLGLTFDHDWSLLVIHLDDGVGIKYGCHWFDDPSAARAHWKAHPDNQRRQIVLPALEALLSIARAQGWRIPGED